MTYPPHSSFGRPYGGQPYYGASQQMPAAPQYSYGPPQAGPGMPQPYYGMPQAPPTPMVGGGTAISAAVVGINVGAIVLLLALFDLEMVDAIMGVAPAAIAYVGGLIAGLLIVPGGILLAARKQVGFQLQGTGCGLYLGMTVVTMIWTGIRYGTVALDGGGVLMLLLIGVTLLLTLLPNTRLWLKQGQLPRRW